MSTTYEKLKEPISKIVFRDDGNWDVYIHNPKEIDPPAINGEFLLCTINMKDDENDIFYDVVTNLLFGHEEIDKGAHQWYGGEEKGSCLVIYDPHMNDDTLLLSEYGLIITLKKIKQKCQTITVKEKY